jgi:hypothetical protein
MIALLLGVARGSISAARIARRPGIGDYKIFVPPLEDCIRTGGRGGEAT